MKNQKHMKVVFTNGCFDLLHEGHLHLLKEARKMGDILIVGICSDKSRIKYCGKKPIHNVKFRAELLESLRFVDVVYIHNEATVENLVKKIRPDIIVKGDEYGKDEVIGGQYAKEIRLVKMKKGFSTTKLIKNLEERWKKK